MSEIKKIYVDASNIETIILGVNAVCSALSIGPYSYTVAGIASGDSIDEQRIADEYGVGYGTVARAEDFAKGLDEADKISPGFREAVLAGEVQIPKQAISAIGKLPDEKRPAAVEAIKRGEFKEAQRP